jgi:uncharacterized protein
LNKFVKQLHKIDAIVFRYPIHVLTTVLLITLAFASQIPAVKMVSDFADLLPQEHPYIQLHNDIRDTFGGANNVIIAVEVKEGTIFTNDTLDRIHRITQAVDLLPSINHSLVSSLTHRTTRKIWLSEVGNIKSTPHYDPTKEGGYSDEELIQMRDDVISNQRVYGLLVSPDLKSALIKGTLHEGQLDYHKVFDGLQKIREKETTADVNIYATGQPVLVGWVSSYVGEILQIFLYTILIMLCLLVIYFRRLYGIILPVIGIVLTSIWGVGILSLLGHNLDPLMMVIPFLISARAMSHGIQIVERYYLELDDCEDNKLAAQKTFNSLFRPGTLGVISDAIGLLLISLGSVPINDKLAEYASLWAFCVIFTVLIPIPVLLSVLPKPKETGMHSGFIRKIFPKIALALASRQRAMVILFISVMLLGTGIYFSSWVQVGEAEPGSPLLYLDHDYNVSSKAINDHFPGSEELFVIAETAENGGLKQPKVINALAHFQNHMLYDPELGGAKGLPNLITSVNRILHNDDPRWQQVPEDPSYVGGLMFAFMMSSPIQGGLLEFLDADEKHANMVFYYKDHKGETIRRAIHQVKAWKSEFGDKVDGLKIKLAGGTIGVTAAINEAAYDTNLVVIPLVLLLIFAFVTVFYWSLHAGFLMMLAMTFATTLSYAYMGIVGMGINVNTVPIIAVGIGVGIDYSIYIMDRIREESRNYTNITDAVIRAISTTGVAVAFTALTLIGGVIMWVFISTLRFQADAALLLSVMLILNAMASVFLVTAWITIFKPEFIVRELRSSQD